MVLCFFGGVLPRFLLYGVALRSQNNFENSLHVRFSFFWVRFLHPSFLRRQRVLLAFLLKRISSGSNKTHPTLEPFWFCSFCSFFSPRFFSFFSPRHVRVIARSGRATRGGKGVCVDYLQWFLFSPCVVPLVPSFTRTVFWGPAAEVESWMQMLY